MSRMPIEAEKIVIKIQDMLKGAFFKNVVTLQMGSILGTLTQAVAGICIARILQPELFGIYALSFSLASLFGIFMATGVGDGITSIVAGAYARGDKETIADALGFLLKIAFIVGIIVALVLTALPLLSNLLYHRYDIGLFAAIVVMASIISNLLFSVSQVAFQAERKIGVATFFIFLDLLVRWGLSLLLVFSGYRILGAAIGHLIGAIIIFSIVGFLWNRLLSTDSLFPRLGQVIHSAIVVSWKRFIRYSFWVALDRNMATLFSFLPISMAGIYFVSSDVAFYKIPFGFTNLALSLLGPVSIMLNIEFPRLREESLAKMKASFLNVTFYSILFSAFLVVCAAIISPIAFKILYGESFMPSVKYVYGFIIYGVFNGLGIGLGPMWRAINKVKVSILINTVVLAIGIPIGLYLLKHYGIWGGVVMVTTWFAISHLISFIYLYKYLSSRS